MTNPFIPAQPQHAPAQQNPYAQPQHAPQPSFQQGAATYPTQPAQQQYAPQMQYSGNPAGSGLVAQPGQFVPLGAPSAAPNSGLPRIKHLAGGRLLIILPTALELGIKSKPRAEDGPNAPAKFYDKMTATVVVLDGGTLVWGGEFQGDERKSAEVPYVIKDLHITQKNIITQCRPALDLRLQGGPGLTVGRLWKTGPAQNDPYVVQEPNAQDLDIYNRYVSQVNPFAL